MKGSMEEGKNTMLDAYNSSRGILDVMARHSSISHSAHDELWIALSSDPFVEKSALVAIKKALDRGADPELSMREFQDFRCAMGLAAGQRSIAAVDMLLDAGACVHWPGDETDIDAIELCGEEDVGYAGEAVDPLTLVAGRLAWELGEYPRDDNVEQARKSIMDLDAMVRHLIKRGADHKRPDPAFARTPFEHLLIDFTEAGGSTQCDIVTQTLGDLMFDLSIMSNPQAASHILAQDWKKLPYWHWEWDEDFPELAEYLVGRAQQVELTTSTPKAVGARSARL